MQQTCEWVTMLLGSNFQRNLFNMNLKTQAVRLLTALVVTSVIGWGVGCGDKTESPAEPVSNETAPDDSGDETPESGSSVGEDDPALPSE